MTNKVEDKDNASLVSTRIVLVLGLISVVVWSMVGYQTHMANLPPTEQTRPLAQDIVTLKAIIAVQSKHIEVTATLNKTKHLIAMDYIHLLENNIMKLELELNAEGP